MAFRVLIAGGGTGGHVTPALAIAEAISRKYPNAIIRFVGTNRGVEARMVPKAGYLLETIRVIALKRRPHLDWVRFPFVLLESFFGSLKCLRAFHPYVLICTGGYVCGPVGVAALLLGVPLVLHEANQYPGLTLRLLSRGAEYVFLSFPGAVRRMGGRRRQVVGTPIRKTMGRVDRSEARKQFGLDPGRQTLLITGASQGSVSMNQAVGEALPILMRQDLQVLWQVGQTDPAPAQIAKSWPGRVVVVPFIDDMAAAYSAADVAVTRSGALTLTELAHIGLPAILIPLPWSAENHQEHNARAVEGAGAGRVILQADLNGEGLAEMVITLLADGEGLRRMAECSRALAVPDAADRLVEGMARAGLCDG